MPSFPRIITALACLLSLVKRQECRAILFSAALCGKMKFTTSLISLYMSYLGNSYLSPFLLMTVVLYFQQAQHVNYSGQRLCLSDSFSRIFPYEFMMQVARSQKFRKKLQRPSQSMTWSYCIIWYLVEPSFQVRMRDFSEGGLAVLMPIRMWTSIPVMIRRVAWIVFTLPNRF